MHTLKVLLTGFALLAVCLLIGRFAALSKGMATASLLFVPLWFIGSGISLYLGVKTAGYSVMEELPVFLVVFLVPALAAGVLWWKFR